MELDSLNSRGQGELWDPVNLAGGIPCLPDLPHPHLKIDFLKEASLS